MVDDLITSLRAQLDEDERVARAATDGPWMWIAGRVSQERAEGRIVISNPGGLAVAEAEDLAHIARHDPARVRAEVNAKRQILDSFAAAQQPLTTRSAEMAVVRMVLRLLALPTIEEAHHAKR